MAGCHPPAVASLSSQVVQQRLYNHLRPGGLRVYSCINQMEWLSAFSTFSHAGCSKDSKSG